VLVTKKKEGKNPDDALLEKADAASKER